MKRDLLTTRVELSEWGAADDIDDSLVTVTLDGGNGYLVTIHHRVYGTDQLPWVVGDTRTLDLETGTIR